MFSYMMRSTFDAEDDSQASLIFQPMHKYIKIITNTK